MSSQAILKYGIRMALTQETKPNMKKRRPMMNIETTVSLRVKERTSMAAVSALLMQIKLDSF